MTFSHLDAVLDEVAELGTSFVAAGHRLFLVGGIVRDQWLDRRLSASSDIDLTTDARPPQIKQIVAPLATDVWTQGEKFGTIGMRIGGRDIEITTHRAESYVSESRKPTVTFGDDLEVDLSRRDFTVNAMAIELPNGELVDPFGGSGDLEARLLRTPLSPEISFADDPLRMLRAARFAAKYSLVPAPELVVSATALHQRLRIVAIERIGVEIRRLLDLEDARVGLDFLARTRLLPEVLSYGEPHLIPQVEARLGHAISTAAQLPAFWHVRLAAIGLVSFDDSVGVRAMCQRLRLSRADARTVVELSQGALGLAGSPATDPTTLRRWAAQTADRGLAIRLAKVLAEQTATIEVFEAALAELEAVEELDEMALLSGASVMELLGIGPGPAVGDALTMLRERWLERGPMAEADQVVAVQAWWAESKH